MAAAIKSYAKFGAAHRCGTDWQTTLTLHYFMMPETTTDAQLKGLPDLPFRFGLELFRTNVTDAGIKELRDLKNLAGLYIVS